MRPTSPSSSAGFTLVEMMMAMLIMTVGLLGLLQSIEVAYRQTARTRIREDALLEAEKQMNSLKSLSYRAIPASQTLSSTGRTGIRYTVTKRAEEISGTPARDVHALKLTVTVSWTLQNETEKLEIYNFKAR